MRALGSESALRVLCKGSIRVLPGVSRSWSSGLDALRGLYTHSIRAGFCRAFIGVL